ncbi:phosphatidylinositol glycan, class H [Coccidioides immitis RS]|uniref:Phosphatidylinositol glycan, class H n=6 Tax=Coccidioides TaxID=5500 RepID=A0A0E1S2T8_COCIM|nr:phosphatidylinositol glycan, class H [Coccidioides immitis RS]EFW20611.1 conserved hypothetical protein [Coccidioides posadasii str. Silveira]KMM72826.1 hypothetical protein CPAG_09118 [Coccidioides posadasii RMSCC 3488]KMP07716.1 hypothetical protein CIRG_07397 [Coccidioides immitis RMSCC 2394]KMU71831.1 hypothetical protein CISG_00141 [Coccidioides immitis RMSCC 3703]KMU82804.1 hypothetical protein CIHG_00586 [Coccidioides immitis H538.4]
MPSRLLVERPSPTTVLFTVSNAPSRSSITSKLLFYLEILLRVIIFAAVLLVDAAKLRDYAFCQDGIIPWSNVWSSPAGLMACHIADRHLWQVIAPSSAVLLYLMVRKGYTEESLLVIRGLGVQTSTSSATYFMSATTRFIPTTQIQDIVIHEAFKGFEVRFYLAIIVEAEAEVVVVFPNLLPRRNILEEVWKGVRKCLYKPGP